MKRLITTTLAFAFAISLLVAPTTVFAWNPFGGIDCSADNVKSSPVCADSANGSVNPLTGPDGLIMDIANVIAFVAGIAAIIIIILAGLRFVTSSGNSEDTAGARRTLIYAVVGLIILVIARVLVAFIVSRI